MPASLRGLRAFRAVMSSGTVTAAAAQLHIGQPALTRLLAGLEADLGLSLFHRIRKRLVPTAAAQAFLAEAERILDRFDEIPTIVKQIRSASVTRLRVVATPRLAVSVVAPAAALFAARHPEVSLAIQMLERAQLEHWLLDEPFDVGLTALPIVHPALIAEPLCEVPAVLALPPGHRLAGRAAVSAADLRDESWVTVLTGSRLRRESDAILTEATVTPRVRIEASTTLLATHLVMAGAGIMLTDPLSVQAIAGDRIAMARWEPVALLRSALLFPAGRGPLAAQHAFATAVRDVIQDRIQAGRFDGLRLSAGT
jgi:DNA-binding transcriptional LysR family regulator